MRARGICVWSHYISTNCLPHGRTTKALTLASDEGRGYHNDKFLVFCFFYAEHPCEQIIWCQDATRLYNSGPASHATNPCNSETFKVKLKHVRYDEANWRHELMLEIIGLFLGLQKCFDWRQACLSEFIVVLQWNITPRDNGEVSIYCLTSLFTDLVDLVDEEALSFWISHDHFIPIRGT